MKDNFWERMDKVLGVVIDVGITAMTILLVFGVIGAAAGYAVLNMLRPDLLKKLFGAMLLITGAPALFRALPRRKKEKSDRQASDP